MKTLILVATLLLSGCATLDHMPRVHSVHHRHTALYMRSVTPVQVSEPGSLVLLGLGLLVGVALRKAR